MKFQPNIKKNRLNHEITAREVRVLNEKDESLGIISLGEALKLAEKQGLDVIETVPNALPPVVKIMSYDKFRYHAGKAEKKERQAQKTGGFKRVQISARAQKNDLLVKVHKLEEFLAEGHQVEIYMRLRGREKYNKDWAKQKLDEFTKMITSEHKIISSPKFSGNGLAVQITKK